MSYVYFYQNETVKGYQEPQQRSLEQISKIFKITGYPPFEPTESVEKTVNGRKVIAGLPLDMIAEAPPLLIRYLPPKHGFKFGHVLCSIGKIPKDTAIRVYSGTWSDEEVYNSYALGVPKDTENDGSRAAKGGFSGHIDAEKAGGGARFAPHLPDDINELRTKYEFDEKTEKEIATANIRFHFMPTHNKSMPHIPVLIASRDIEEGEILGFDYGLQTLIHDLEDNPGFLTLKGEIISPSQMRQRYYTLHCILTDGTNLTCRIPISESQEYTNKYYYAVLDDKSNRIVYPTRVFETARAQEKYYIKLKHPVSLPSAQKWDASNIRSKEDLKMVSSPLPGESEFLIPEKLAQFFIKLGLGQKDLPKEDVVAASTWTPGYEGKKNEESKKKEASGPSAAGSQTTPAPASEMPASAQSVNAQQGSAQPGSTKKKKKKKK